MDKLTAKDLKRRYRAGERNFAGVDLSGESLRGMNLKSIDLSGADLSRTDIRGTNFTEANLKNTRFVEAKAGTQRRWLATQLLIAFVPSAFASFLIALYLSYFAVRVFSTSGEVTGNIATYIVFEILGITIFLGLLRLIYARGILATLGIVIGAFAVAVAGIVAGAGAIAGAIAVAVTFNVAIAGAVAFDLAGPGIVAFAISITIVVAIAAAVAFAFVIAGAVALAVALAFAFPAAGVFTFIVAGAIGGTFAVVGSEPIVIANVVVGTFTYIAVNLSIARRALKGDPRDSLIRALTVWFCSWGGTNFAATNLTDASFENATLKSTHLYQANLTKTHFHLGAAMESLTLALTSKAHI